MSDVQPLVLAAGASSRMGRPKAALPLGETSALGLILRACAAAGLRRAVVVTGAHPEATAAAAPADVPAPRLVHNEAWASGRTSSIRAGLGGLDAEAGAWLLWPVDVCLPGAAVLAALLAARGRTPEALAWVPSHAHRRGHPLLLAREAGPRFLSLGPDEPARAVVRALAAEGALVHVEVEDPAVLWDMDTPADYARLREELTRRG